MKLVGISLATLVLVFSTIYLLTGWMIPGLLPFAQAALMIPMFLLWRKQTHHRWIGTLFAVAAVLNVIAGIMQIVVYA